MISMAIITIVNRNFGDPLIMTFRSRSARAKLRVNSRDETVNSRVG